VSDKVAEGLKRIMRREPRYRIEAYTFLLEALEYTLQELEKPRHVSGRELLDGIRRYAIHKFGPTSRMVFEHWGVRSTEDFGRMVFLLVAQGILTKTESDSIDDFADGFDFKKAFEDEYSWTSE
jgi:uncharacterized repeat protein (TIGR04138 family)